MACTTLAFSDEIFGFHVQQAVEKSLKAWMCALGITYPFTHHINRLLVLLQDAGAEVEAFWWTDEFTLYAQQARYEEGFSEADEALNRRDVLLKIDSMLAFVEKAIQVRRQP